MDPSPHAATGVKRLRRLLSRRAVTGGFAGLCAFLGIGYATAVTAHAARVTRYRIAPRGWPAGRRLRIAVLSDLHANVRHVGEEDISRIVEQANALRPDVVVLLGDYCSQDVGPVPPEAVARLLSGLRAPLGVHAVQGNHDWLDDRESLSRGHGPTRVERAFREAGIGFLSDEAVPLGATGAWLVGMESEEARNGGRPMRGSALDTGRLATLGRLLDAMPEGVPAIVLAHEPDLFAAIRDPRVALTLSGHTHGGQVRVMGWSPWIPSRFGLRYAYGHVVEEGRHLVVTGGIGSHFVLGHPLRIGMPPEIVLVEIEAPDPPPPRSGRVRS